MRKGLLIIGLLLPFGLAGQSTEPWDLPPLEYSGRDPEGPLAARVERGGLAGAPGSVAALCALLERLGIDESTQTLVFSKTSKQIRRIDPETPRALYFSEDAYVGYVPGGALEVIVHDALLGPVFYLVRGDSRGELEVMRDRSECFSCHGTSRTERVPGMLVRSVFPDAGGRPIGPLGSTTVTDATPLAERWGGYFVTGRSPLPHLGNQVFEAEGEDPEPRPSALERVAVADAGRYPRATSDVVALLVLEHQCRMHNLLTAASQRYRRVRFLGQAIDPERDPDEGQAGRIADSLAERVVEALLFADAAELGEGVEGDEEFQREWTARFPRAAGGDSLADFRLYGRLFKNRCSYMVYSGAFRALPATVRARVFERLRAALADEGGAEHLGASERRRIREILTETLPGFVEAPGASGGRVTGRPAGR